MGARIEQSVVLGASAEPFGATSARARSRAGRNGSIPWPERYLDLTLTLLALPLILVVGAAIALAVFIDSPGSVIYRSRRIGAGGRSFEMLKFRKMRQGAPSHPLTVGHDKRFTPIGNFLAATRLDELPQIVNVLRGEMRLVGPRPELECFVAEYAEEYAEILTVTPGITGNAQLRFVDEWALLSGPSPSTTYTNHVLPAKIRIDLDYVRRHGLRTDLGIVARTVLLPLALTTRRLRQHAGALRPWFPSLAAATVLTLAFVLVSSRLP